MGLNIVKKIVDKVKGEISIESKPVQGTNFKIILNRYFLQENDKIRIIADNEKIISSEF